MIKAQRGKSKHMYTKCRYTTKKSAKREGSSNKHSKLGFNVFPQCGESRSRKILSQKVSGLKKVLRQRIWSFKVYPDQHTKKHPNGEPVKNGSIQKVNENVPGLTKWNSLLHTKRSLFNWWKMAELGRSEIWLSRHCAPIGQKSVRPTTTFRN